VGPCSQGVDMGGLVFLSGMLGLDPARKTLTGTMAGAQAEQALKNIRTVLKATGLECADAVKATVLLADMNDFAAVNAVDTRFFGK
jgi:2-iminobutanoate/2-iminopropanoate deaminase